MHYLYTAAAATNPIHVKQLGFCEYYFNTKKESYKKFDALAVGIKTVFGTQTIQVQMYIQLCL